MNDMIIYENGIECNKSIMSCSVCFYNKVCKNNKYIVESKLTIGLKPHDIWVKQRIQEIKEAINRYVVANLEVPFEWIDEYNKLVREVEKYE